MSKTAQARAQFGSLYGETLEDKLAKQAAVAINGGLDRVGAFITSNRSLLQKHTAVHELLRTAKREFKKAERAREAAERMVAVQQRGEMYRAACRAEMDRAAAARAEKARAKEAADWAEEVAANAQREAAQQERRALQEAAKVQSLIEGVAQSAIASALREAAERDRRREEATRVQSLIAGVVSNATASVLR